MGKPDKPLMAKAFGDVIGATKRRVQLWSDYGILEFLPGSGGARGNQRLYSRSELPFALMAHYMAESGVNIGAIKRVISAARHSAHDTPGYIIICNKDVRRINEQDLMDTLKHRPATLVVRIPCGPF